MKKRQLARFLFWMVFLFLANLAFHSARWYIKFFGDVGFTAILFTLFSGLNGVDSWIVKDYLIHGLLFACATTVFLFFVIFHPGRVQLRMVLRKAKKEIWLIPFHPKIQGIVGSVVCVVLLVLAANLVQFPKWLSGIANQSQIFEESYVSPDDVAISFPEKKRNLIYITMESMETSFFSEKQGGAQESCVIPNLYAMAEENVNFSGDAGVGGGLPAVGTTWTVAGILSQSSGVPLLMPIDIDHFVKALPGVVTIWDILAQNGYSQTVMMGSKSEFSGQYELMSQHGINKILDYHKAIEEGLIPEDYFVFWGMEDEKLFSYAKKELLEMAAVEEPFALSLQTIDTHATGGYYCRLCENEYAEQYDNVYACADRQVAEFVDWVKQQPFYENTTIIICGDHLSMDAAYITRKNILEEKRRVYNCIINAPVEGMNTKKRVFTSMDIFPTALAAIGCTIEGERLGLGTNLFSDCPTLAEEMGIEQLDLEINNATIPFARKFM